MFQKKLPNDETEADRYIPKDTGKASLKNVPKIYTYLQKKDSKLLMN